MSPKRVTIIFLWLLLPRIWDKKIVEREMVALLDQQGIKATSSLTLLPNNFGAEHASDKRAILDKVQANGNDAITISLADQDN